MRKYVLLALLFASCSVDITTPKPVPQPVKKVQVHRAAAENKAESSTVSVNLAWSANPEPDIAGYRIHSGPAAGAYDQNQDVGNVTTATLNNLPIGRNYFALTAYNQNGFESGLSDEVSAGQEVSPTPTETPAPSPTLTATASPSPTATQTPAATPSPYVQGSLVNISTRAFVQGADNILIAGFIIQGGQRKVIIRAIGPSLAPSFPLTLPDPFLELRNSGGGLLAQNDNWRDDQEQEIIATGVAPVNDLEAAIVRTLPPGNYTAVVHGVNNGTGVALVEVYALGN